MMRDEDGTAAITTVLLLPLLLTVLVGVLQLGALRILATRVASAADLATLAATDDQDADALVRTGLLRLAPDAVAVTRQYFSLNLAQVATQLAVPPDQVAASANVAAFGVAPAMDPLTGWRYDRPSVRLQASVPLRAPAFGVLLMKDVVLIDVRSASAAR